MEKQQRAVKTTAQALAQQKADAERERQQKAPVKSSQAVLDRFAAKPNGQQQQEVVPAAKQTVALPDTRTEHQKYLDEIAPSTIAGRPIKFDGKSGAFVFEDTDEVIGPDTDFIALCDETLVGWIRFHRDGETPPDRIQGLLCDGFVMPPDTELPDNDPATWGIGLSGLPESPWQHQMNLVLQTPGTHELATFRTTSKTGRRAVGNLLKHYDRMRKKDDDHYPVTRLKIGGYNHRDTRVGWVHTPTFAVVGKAPKVSAAIPDTSTKGDMSDEIPF
jgi:hypothetical protein